MRKAEESKPIIRKILKLELTDKKQQLLAIVDRAPEVINLIDRC